MLDSAGAGLEQIREEGDPQGVRVGIVVGNRWVSARVGELPVQAAVLLDTVYTATVD